MKTIVFDLDGTLTNTLTDLMNSTNHALRECGMAERSYDEVRRFVGNGVHKLIERAVPEGTPEERIEECFAVFKAYYIVHCQDTTTLYDGVADMLRELKERGYRIAIVSNKLQAGVDELYNRWFHSTVDVAIGERRGIPRKPAADMVELALSELGAQKSEAVYVGDSDVDLLTARNSGLPCVSVLWGFRDRDFLVANGATRLAAQPADVVRIIDEIFK